MSSTREPDGPFRLSIVIPVHGQIDRLVRCLRAVRDALERSTDLRAETIVVDDATPGGVAAEIRRDFPEVRWIRNDSRQGFGCTVNRGVELAGGDIVFSLNSDMYVAPGFFSSCLEPFESPTLFAICCRIDEPGGVDAGAKTLDLRPNGAAVRFETATPGSSTHSGFVPYANGGGSLFRRDLFLELGGFDPIFSPYYWEDTDLGYRAWKRGYEIVHAPSLRIEHDHQGTIGEEDRRDVQRIRSRNRRLFVWRNLTDVSLGGLLLRGTLREALGYLLRLRLRRLGWLLADLRWLPEVVRARRREREFERRSDAEVREVLGWEDETDGTPGPGIPGIPDPES